jgi:hypothetical protein
MSARPKAAAPNVAAQVAPRAGRGAVPVMEFSLVSVPISGLPQSVRRSRLAKPRLVPGIGPLARLPTGQRSPISLTHPASWLSRMLLEMKSLSPWNKYN